MKKITVFISVFLVLGFLITSHASEITLSVPWHPQLKSGDSMGTLWAVNMNCGPTALSMLSGYLRGFTPNSNKIKQTDDWLYSNELISAINSYDLVYGEGTGYDDLRAAAAYLFGLWNSKYYSISALNKDAQINAIRDSLNNNKPVIIGVKTNMSVNGTWHWMLAVGLRDSNNDGIFEEIKVNDPGKSTELNSGVRWYSIADFKNVLFGSIFFYNDYGVGQYNESIAWHNEPWYNNDYSSAPSWNEPSLPFVDTYINNGGPDTLGYPTSMVYQVNAPSGVSMYAQDFSKDGHVFTLFLNRHIYNLDKQYLGIAFPIHGQIKNFWQLNYQLYGPPASNEYCECAGYSFANPCAQCPANNLYIVQWFEPYDNQYVKIAYKTSNGIFNDYTSQGFTYGNHLNQGNEINVGYKTDGYGIGAGGGTLPAFSDGYEFIGSFVCDGWTYGSANSSDPNYWDLEPVNIRNQFEVGQTAQFMVKLTNISVNHRYHMQIYRNGTLLREQTEAWLYPSPMWGYSSFTPYQTNLQPGDYEVKFYLDIGSGFSMLDSKTFTVAGNNYTYTGSVVCGGWTYGTGDLYWDLQPVDPRTNFSAGETVYVLAQLHNVFVDHEWKLEVWKNGSYLWENRSGLMDVDNVNGWGFSNFTPYLQNVLGGSYEFRIFLDEGGGFVLKDTKPFTVVPANQTIPYTQNFTNGNDDFQKEDHLSTASLYLSDTAGYGGGKCLILNNTQSVSSWQVQVKKTGWQLSQGISYQGEIKMKGDTAGIIYIAMERAVDPWDNFGLWKMVYITTNWQTIDLDFTAVSSPQLDPNNVKFTIQAGEFIGNLYIDDIGFQ